MGQRQGQTEVRGWSSCLQDRDSLWPSGAFCFSQLDRVFFFLEVVNSPGDRCSFWIRENTLQVKYAMSCFGTTLASQADKVENGLLEAIAVALEGGCLFCQIGDFFRSAFGKFQGGMRCVSRMLLRLESKSVPFVDVKRFYGVHELRVPLPDVRRCFDSSEKVVFGNLEGFQGSLCFRHCRLDPLFPEFLLLCSHSFCRDLVS